jgi:hypothetical protein
MKHLNHKIPCRLTRRSDQGWSDVFHAIAEMRETLERIGYRDGPKELARETLKRFNNSIEELK